MEKFKELTLEELTQVEGGTFIGYLIGCVVGALAVAGEHEHYINQHGVPGGHAMMQ